MGDEFFNFIEFLIRNISGRLGRTIRYSYYRRRLGGCGKNVVIEQGVFFQSSKFIFLGDAVWVDKYSILIAGPFSPQGRKFHHKANENYKGEPGQMKIGNGVHIAPFVLLQAHAGLSIGNSVTVASGAKVYTLSHHYRNLNDLQDSKRYSFSSMAAKEDQFLIVSPVVIGDRTAVGLNSVVLPGTTISDGTWLGVLTHVDSKVTESNAVFTSESALKR